ncbi:glycosyltransferase involved in cell wall biosynthesis [Desulfobaculum xiamenense]|uniref:Glycosyltransferase involved in cell wall biosynthesis n=1 Tax=Desulfobaculum xiamenense TaxID=995050 RepID=A0A846QN10_9BACT|nr:glycosyltransferase family 4 protein [Desulfobaculum xiamenense]NJB66624.1 glycosyltransferase involved in cell wall biosynthesis [Desulfobaculum xiamenense]
MSDMLWLAHSGATLPSVRFRVLPFVADARERGIDADWVRLPKTAIARMALLFRLPRVKTLVVQKALLSPLFVRLLRSRCERLVFDFDDALWTRHPNQGARDASADAKALRRLERMCSAVDLVIAGNSFLAEKVRHVSRKQLVLPTPLDTDAYAPPADAHVRPGQPVVGWMGTSCNHFFLPEIFDSLESVADAVRVYVVSDREYALPEVFDGIFDFWDSEREVGQLQAMDIGLMPLTDDEYTRGKCGFKLLQYMACGVVPVASDVGFNREIITHGRDGFLAQTPRDFAEYVGLLAREHDLRAEMARHARETVVARFGLSAAAERLWRELELI